MVRLLKGNTCCLPSLGLAVVDVDDVAAAVCLALFQPQASGRCGLPSSCHWLLIGPALLSPSTLLPIHELYSPVTVTVLPHVPGHTSPERRKSSSAMQRVCPRAGVSLLSLLCL